MEINVCGVKYKIVQLEDVDNNPSCLGLCIYKDSLYNLNEDYHSSEKNKYLSMSYCTQ
ncbi:hypothetical protein ACI6C6_06440 [Staphylococcus aureus]|uniref:hypothetical protein n=1 Tax=Staphylococcus aureus TaxID=1280 RepID=UPI003851FBD0